ncbi:flagellar biosynthesis protein FlgB [Burkholderia ubonensis]|uniref:flagellar basal body rod protein FlgB n=1 Tax=Burkholderia ubonensis TaxID=101571 RepID=UPI00075C6F91|nr:flagellar basal body rod protein FlgB [Burkholderia ubonensis]KVO87665.1 flagellar biosynthesis protein FlgB [Burkholderia ubonensis]KVZ57282.1 flagellar biosynthesis protein FlgB [Burkholderia ubonensis]KVZ73033.1 flagellar biosynthesis protein FlgB [Burkholderia ubonensis]
MGLNFEQALGVHAAALKVRAERTRILASNLANESTPGYQARDLDFRASLEQVLAGDGAGASLSARGDALQYRVPSRPSQDGNTVELGVEQAAFSQNASDFQTSLTFVNMKIKGLQAAITGNT